VVVVEEEEEEEEEEEVKTESDVEDEDWAAARVKPTATRRVVSCMVVEARKTL
jgi:hypothetical protein